MTCQRRRDSQLHRHASRGLQVLTPVLFVLILLVVRFGHGQSSIEIRKERKLHVSSMLDRGRGRATSVDRPEDDQSTGWSSRVLSAVVWMPIRTVHIRVSVRFGIHLGSNW